MTPEQHRKILEMRVKLAFGVLDHAVQLCAELHERGSSALDCADELRRWQRFLVIRGNKVEMLDEHPQARA